MRMEFLEPRICTLNIEIHYKLVQMTVPIYIQYKMMYVFKLSPTLRIIKFINPWQFDTSKNIILFYSPFLLWPKLSTFSCF